MGSKESIMTPQGGLGVCRETRGSASHYEEPTNEAEAEAPSAASDYGNPPLRLRLRPPAPPVTMGNPPLKLRLRPPNTASDYGESTAGAEAG